MVYGNILINRKKYNKQHIISLEDVSLEDIPEESTYQVVLNPLWAQITKQRQLNTRMAGWSKLRTSHLRFMQLHPPKRTNGWHTSTSVSKNFWREVSPSIINHCLTSRLAAGRTPSLAAAAVWVPDDQTKICMYCKKTQFTVINRRVCLWYKLKPANLLDLNSTIAGDAEKSFAAAVLKTKSWFCRNHISPSGFVTGVTRNAHRARPRLMMMTSLLERLLLLNLLIPILLLWTMTYTICVHHLKQWMARWQRLQLLMLNWTKQWMIQVTPRTRQLPKRRE